jgi:hypothetical protein
LARAPDQLNSDAARVRHVEVPNAEGALLHVRDFERSFVMKQKYTNMRSFVKGEFEHMFVFVPNIRYSVR